MDVKVGDFYEYTGKTGFDLVQNNTYPIINIDKNNNVDIRTDNGHKIFSWEKFITVFEPVILNSCSSSIKAGDTVKCIKSLAYFDEGCTYTVLDVSSTGRVVIRDKFGNSKYVESYEFNTYFTTTFQVNDSSIVDNSTESSRELGFNAVERCKYCGKPATHEGLCEKYYNMRNY